MVDVTVDNFGELLPQILDDLGSASFVAIDTEFTGLLADQAFRGNLFDDGQQRYHKLCANMRRVTICQLGLAIYKGVRDQNTYTVSSYNIYLRPHSCGDLDPTFLCQTSSIEFLQAVDFDFNKWLYKGVGSMNREEEQQLRQDLTALLQGTKAFRLPYKVQEEVSRVGQWVVGAGEGDSTTFTATLPSQVLLLASLHSTFQDLWAFPGQGEQIIVKKVSEAERERLKAAEGDGLVDTYVERMLGVTAIIRRLAQLRKPLVLHNCLLDLLLLYKQFHQPLPSSYHTFKSELHSLFPLIYDTKLLASELHYHHSNNDRVRSLIANSSLGSLATALRKELPVLFRPSLTHQPPHNKYSSGEVLLHEAGYDAFLTGLCFLSLAHLHAMLQLPSALQHRPLSPREHLHAVAAWANCIQVSRATIKHMNLGGGDPRSHRPPWLLVEGRGVRVSPGLVSSTLAPHGPLDVLSRSHTSVLVAASSWKSTNEILKELSSHSQLRAQVYRGLRHSPWLRTLAWSGVVVSSGLSVWLMCGVLRKPPS